MWFWGKCQSLNTVCAVHLTAAVGSDGGCLTQQGQLDHFSQNLLARCSLFSVRTLDTWSYKLPWALGGSWSLPGKRTMTRREQGQDRHSYYLSAGSSGFRSDYYPCTFQLWEPVIFICLHYFEMVSVSWMQIVLSDTMISVGNDRDKSYTENGLYPNSELFQTHPISCPTSFHGHLRLVLGKWVW